MWQYKTSRRDFLKISAMTSAASLFNLESLKAIPAAAEDMEKYPVVVIGAGLGGLTCAAYLAKAGLPVSVLEQHHVPGGYATSFERGYFEFEVSLHAISAKNNATYTICNDLGLLDKIELIELQQSHRLISNGRDLILPDQDVEAYIQLLSENFPAEKTGIRNFVTEMLGIQKEVYKLFLNNNEYITLLFPFQYSKMWDIRNKTLKNLLDEHVQHPRLKDDLSYLCGYYGLPPSKLSGFYYANSVADYLKNGSYYIKGRSQDLSNALADIIREHGGTLSLNTPAESIIVKSGEVTGVRTAGGNFLPARFVVSNAGLPDTFGSMLSSDVDYSDYRNTISKFRPSISSFCIWLGLDSSLRGQIPGCNIHIGSEDGVEKGYHHSLKCDADRVGYTVTLFDNYYEGYSMPGKSTIMLTFLSGYQPWKPFEKDYVSGHKKEYYIQKEKIAETLIKRTEKNLIPGLSSMIEEVDSATPLTNIRFTGNPEGAIYGYEQAMNNQFMDRIKNNTPVQGLYIASAWGFPGGGFTGVMRGGRRTAGMILDSL